MLQGSYAVLDSVSKLSIQATAQSSVLISMIETEIQYVKDSLCNMTPGPDLLVQYAVTQQRLISLQDLQDFFKRIRKEVIPQNEEE